MQLWVGKREDIFWVGNCYKFAEEDVGENLSEAVDIEENVSFVLFYVLRILHFNLVGQI